MMFSLQKGKEPRLDCSHIGLRWKAKCNGRSTVISRDRPYECLTTQRRRNTLQYHASISRCKKWAGKARAKRACPAPRLGRISAIVQTQPSSAFAFAFAFAFAKRTCIGCA